MQACTVPIVIATLVLAGCGAPQPTRPAPAQAQPTAVATPATVKLVRCDDGGSGGVMIDGICL